jgi:hypothetical protein
MGRLELSAADAGAESSVDGVDVGAMPAPGAAGLLSARGAAALPAGLAFFPWGQGGKVATESAGQSPNRAGRSRAPSLRFG